MKYSRIALAVSLTCLSGGLNAKTWSFDSNALDGRVDVSVFNAGGQLPGTYHVDILLNGEPVDTQDVEFVLKKDANEQSVLTPCLTVEQLSHYGVKVEDYPGLTASGGFTEVKEGRADSHGDENSKGGEVCANLNAISQAKTEFLFNNQQLQLSIPQVAMRPHLRGIAPRQLWDDGIPALLLNYSANTNRTEYRDGAGGNDDSTYVQLNPGANIGAWRLRNQTNWQKQSNDSGKWQTLQTYAERGLYDNQSRLTLGERFTPSDIFDSVPFRGVMLGTDDSMVPYNQREYAPVIRGIARTQARVEVKQNGYTIYSEMVAPGAFALSDLSVPASGGELQVTVQETDGQTQTFTVPYQTPAIAVHEGYLNYAMMVGQYRPADSAIDKSLVGQLTAMYGLPWGLTAYGGLQGAEHYSAVTAGLGLSMGDWGSISLDGTEARGRRREQEEEQGGTWRVRYSKEINATNTTFTLASYQYASSGYYTLSDVLDSYRGNSSPDDWWYYDDNERRKSNTSLTLNQSMGAAGYISVSGTRQDYWDRTGHDETLTLGYGVSLGSASVSLNWSRNKRINGTGEKAMDNLTTMSVSFPLGGSTYANYQYTAPSEGAASHELGLSGQSFSRRLNWNLTQDYLEGKDNSSRNASAMNLSWDGGYGVVGGNYRYSSSLRQMGVNVAGGVVAHSHGITFGQPLSDTVALIEAPGASGVLVSSWPGVKTDFRGYTLSPGLAAYQENTVSLDPTALISDAEIAQTDVNVVPTQGAVIPVKFQTRVGGRGMMTLTRPDGSEIPLGAVATMAGVSAGIVGDDGQVYLTGLPDKGQLTVKWSGNQCKVNYQLPAEKGVAGLYVMQAVCG
ncbi:fimbria/pilus outer membrane usher protein [Serratia sp. 2723]|uniref:fimbria/pilus outer membrane usher protein n=1 Tax=unclassified Serratia (in: enterobacteria) TaxID=2647522 RepID=UPI003D24264D